MEAMSVGSHLCQGGGSGRIGDASPRVVRQMISALAAPLYERDRIALQGATRIALACDERDAVMLVHLRCLVRSRSEGGPHLYECVLGPVRDFGTGWKACADAIKQALRDACITREGRRAADGSTGVADRLDEDLFSHICNVLEVAVADGGTDVQKALYELSPGGEQPLFPNLCHISRDRAHRFRSVQKGLWDAARDLAGDFLSSLVSGPQSLARMLESSRKYSLIFERVQRDQRALAPEDPALFTRTLRNFQFAEARFDSRSKPLMALLSSLPLVLSTLQALLHEGDDADRRWAHQLLKQFSGDAGFERQSDAGCVWRSGVACPRPLIAGAQSSSQAGDDGPRCRHHAHRPALHSPGGRRGRGCIAFCGSSRGDSGDLANAPCGRCDLAG